MFALLLAYSLFTENKIMALLVINNMISVVSLLIISPSSARYNLLIAYRHIVNYTANIFHRIIIWRLTSLLNKWSQINNWLLVHKKQLMSCTVCFCLESVLVGAEKRRKKTGYNN